MTNNTQPVTKEAFVEEVQVLRGKKHGKIALSVCGTLVGIPDGFGFDVLATFPKALKEVDRRAREEVEEKYKEIMTFDCMCDGTMLCAYHAERGYKVGWRGFADLTNLTPNQ